MTRVALLLLSLTAASILAEVAYRVARRARYRSLAAEPNALGTLSA